MSYFAFEDLFINCKNVHIYFKEAVDGFTPLLEPGRS